jgi:CrcB protein
MQGILLVAIGGAIGSVLRYGAGLGFARMFPQQEFLGTLFVNITGSGLLGLLLGWLLTLESPRNLLWLFAATGLCGGFTTFSTFSREAVMMMSDGAFVRAAGYIAASVTGALAALIAGIAIANRVF